MVLFLPPIIVALLILLGLGPVLNHSEQIQIMENTLSMLNLTLTIRISGHTKLVINMIS